MVPAQQIPILKLDADDFEVEFEVLPPLAGAPGGDPRKLAITRGLSRVGEREAAIQQRIDTLNTEIDRLTNHADGLDYMVAVGSGVLAGLIDSFWVGAFDLTRGKAWSNRRVNDFVMKVARAKGFRGERLDGAIKHLEEKFRIPSDNAWRGQNRVSPRSHRLDDLAHHPTPIGLLCSIITQFTKEAYAQDRDGTFIAISLDMESRTLIGKDIPSKIFAGTVNWFFHLVSDMSGTSKTAGKGMGIPGPILSLIKEFSTIPGINRTGLPEMVHQEFVKTGFDLRSELAVAYEVGRQAVPVILNEVLVRAFYFLRRLTQELCEKRDFAQINWKKTLPWKNRSIVRMLTVATGTFTAVDLADAAIRAALTSGEGISFACQFLLRVNFVGVGRFAIAIGWDVYMGAQRSQVRNERMGMYSELLALANAKVFYMQADMWVAAESTHKAIEEVLCRRNEAAQAFREALCADIDSLRLIGEYIPEVERQNPGLTAEISGELEF